MYTLNCNGIPVLAEKPLIMGILNYTDDSFYAGSRLTSDEQVIQQAKGMETAGADILDIGVQSTRPGSVRISAAQEIAKIERAIPLLKRETGCLVSVDTYHAPVAEAAVAAGADMINDISGGTMDPQMIATAGRLNVPYICMHIRGTPADMQHHTAYDDILKDILDFFVRKINECQSAGIHDIIIDPGIGFAKTIAQNFFLLRNLPVFSILEKPILIGVSRKSFIYKTLGITPDEALTGTTVLNTAALLHGAHILRVHDVREAVETRQLVEMMNRAGVTPDAR